MKKDGTIQIKGKDIKLDTGGLGRQRARYYRTDLQGDSRWE
jgi:hypothetical protein